MIPDCRWSCESQMWGDHLHWVERSNRGNIPRSRSVAFIHYQEIFDIHSFWGKERYLVIICTDFLFIFLLSITFYFCIFSTEWIYDVLNYYSSELGEKALERILRGAGHTLLISKHLITLVITLFSIIIHWNKALTFLPQSLYKSAHNLQYVIDVSGVCLPGHVALVMEGWSRQIVMMLLSEEGDSTVMFISTNITFMSSYK